ncbi:pyridoxal phosphate-dependent aminotransferase [Ancylobacter defluvii]|uniref:aspartate transaminase n=1 Tax=Ancylobacter defluvii TaxID=1282440 RepID=A0A9W6JTD9_9HYPH|nr:pyridoxal phosphate-dependent aminotransferase [Ancylobacter defluvii]MBS7590219.1 pyridoxal phosphate-dependent aminotransferase [Ancylobacter defluvii]GLK82862.1 aminotransferase [Ancylobacter defluvii]
MFQIAERLARVKPSPTVMLNGRVAELAAQGRSVLSLVAGEPDFDTPEHIKQAAKDAIDRGDTKYTAVNGTPALRAAIARKFERENGLAYKPDEIIVGSGGKQVVYNALMASLSAGDEVIIPAPYWVSYPEMVLLAEATPVIVPCAPEKGFRLDPADLDAAITERTRWVILNSPSNPSGAAYRREELAALAEVLLCHPQVWILTDDIYEHLTYGDFRFTTIAAVEPRLRSRTLTMNGVSKTYCMTGWRIGYAGGPKPLIRAMSAIQSHSTTNACSISQAAAVAALDGPQDFIAGHVAAFARRRDRVAAGLNAIEGLTCRVPEGAFYLFASCEALLGSRAPDGQRITTDEDVALYLLDAAGVGLVHGSAFGCPGYVRLSYAASDEKLDAAIARIGVACAALETAASAQALG